MHDSTRSYLWIPTDMCPYSVSPACSWIYQIQDRLCYGAPFDLFVSPSTLRSCRRSSYLITGCLESCVLSPCERNWLAPDQVSGLWLSQKSSGCVLLLLLTEQMQELWYPCYGPLVPFLTIKYESNVGDRPLYLVSPTVRI